MDNDPNDAPGVAQDDAAGGFLSNILTPGSSLNPTFLLILDGAFATLLLVFIGLLVITHWNIHLMFLVIIEGCLWASVKWFVSELQNVHTQEAAKKGENGPLNKTARRSKTD